MVTPWDTRLASRTAALTCVFVLLAVLITGATDEGGVAWSERMARVFPLVPVCGAVATALVMNGLRARGEGRALEALGRSPFASGGASAMGAAAVGASFAMLLLVATRLPVNAFFPAVHASGTFTYDAGVFTHARSGWRIMADGSIELPSEERRAALMAALDGGPGLPSHARLCAALLSVIAGLAFPLTVAAAPRKGDWMVRILAMLTTASATAVFLQAGAAGRLPLVTVPMPSLMLLLGAGWVIVQPSKEPRRSSG